MSDSASVWNPRDPVPTVSNYSSIVDETFTIGVASKTGFVLSNFAFIAGTRSIVVYKNGALLVPTVDYVETSGTSFSLIVPAVLNDVIYVIGFLGYIQAVVDPYYLGPKAAAPTLDNQGVALAAGHEGYTYWSTTSKDFWNWTGTVWQLQGTSVATSANLVAIADAGGYYVGANGELAFQEIGAEFAALAAKAETLTNKTLTLPKINEAVDLVATSTELDAAAGVILGTTQASKNVTTDADGDITHVGSQLHDVGEGCVFNGDVLAAANTLDDYEEGTWTPSIQDNDNNDAEGQTYASQAGSYTKVGDLVTLIGHIHITSIGTLTPAHQVRIGGIPFTPINLPSSITYDVAVGYGTGFTLTAGTSVTGWIQGAFGYIQLNSWDDINGVTNLLLSELSLPTLLSFSLTYKV